MTFSARALLSLCLNTFTQHAALLRKKMDHGLAVLACLMFCNGAFAASLFQTLDLSVVGGGGNTTISAVVGGCTITGPAFPYSPVGGSTTFQGVPFVIQHVANNAWNAHTEAGGGGGQVSKVYNISANNAFGFFTLASLYWGLNPGTAYVTYVFTFSDATTYQVSLANNVDLRDFLNPSIYANSINGTTTVNAFSSSTVCSFGGTPQTANLDRQYIKFPAPYAGKNLVSFTVVDNGSPSVSRIFLIAATAQVGAAVIGGSVNGLTAGDTLILKNNGGDDLSLTTNGAFTFSTQINNGDAYAATVGTHPNGKTCTVTNGAGTVATPAADITNISVNCVANTITTSIPSLSDWGVIILSGLMAVFGLWQVRRRGIKLPF